MKNERGFALLAVLLVLALLVAIGAEFAYSMRLEAAAVRGYKAAVAGGFLAEAALEQAVREIVGQGQWVALDDDGQLTFFAADRRPLERLARSRVKLGGGEFSYRITDEEGRLNLNTSAPDRVNRLLEVLGVDRRERDVIGDSLQDWRDPNEEHRLNGAESEDYYLKLPRPYHSKNGNLDSLRELLQIRGVTPALFKGAGDRPGLADLTTVKTTGQININTAPPEVLAALALSPAEISEIGQARRQTPYTQVPPRFGGRGLAVVSRTFRIEAEGWVDGKPAARLVAIVQKQTAGAGETVAVLEWSGLR
ncbi:MAG: general secretion pathway protein GspK [Candidatus Rokuibacteriota bacterium]